MSRLRRILIVDDELGIREGCKRALVGEGYDAEYAEDGTSGYKKMKEGSYDLILVDLMMPGVGGLDFIQMAHKLDPEIILVVITGFATIETAVEATKRGAYDYLPKPFTPEALAAVVKRGLEKRDLRLEALTLLAEREQQLLELSNEQSRIRTIISCMADGVLVCNMEDQLVLWNASAVKMLKMKNTDVSGESLDHYIKNASIRTILREVMCSEDKNFSMISKEIPVADQGTCLMANMALVKDEKEDVLGTVTVLRDITELKEVEKIKSQFVSMVAHELRAPLAAVEGWLEVVLSGEGGGDAKQKEQWLKRAKERAHSLLTLVNDLLVINRIEAGKIAQKMESIQLSKVVPAIIEFLEPEARRRNISIEFNFPETLAPVRADVKDIEKLFTNLISNAIKYNVEGGSISVEALEDESYVCIRVTDTGIGISAEDVSHVFDDFYRADDEQTKNITGTGLGLTIAKKIVDSHFGRIEVKSEKGKGSSFITYLPRNKNKYKRSEH